MPTFIFAESGIMPISAESDTQGFTLNCKSAVLMEASTGKVLFAQNQSEALPPASVTKIMTLLLVMEAIEDGRLKWDDTVVTSERAASMGGSQIYLEVGESMSVEDMVKSVVIASANDAACALAEKVAGSEEEFVRRMNKRADELGMVNTKFENTNGLDDTASEHLTSAMDIAIMSRELIKHEKILEYSSIWMDTVRNGAFGLTNTNRLVRFYNGCTGLKTGSTSKAGFCISATAERDGMSLICVIMGAETRDIRNAEATKLLDYGYANYDLYVNEGGAVKDVKVTGGCVNSIDVVYPKFTAVVPAGRSSAVELKTEIPTTLTAPLKNGEIVGKVSFVLDGKTIGEINAVAGREVEQIGYLEILWRMIAKFVLL
ncbi:MAG: D-alanyl-D-alanine carboxypeptidase [Clostridia bacterium]|nr:D-alanyl-D-alanine carboxypeptidase [Clostridia bacterium]